MLDFSSFVLGFGAALLLCASYSALPDIDEAYEAANSQFLTLLGVSLSHVRRDWARLALGVGYTITSTRFGWALRLLLTEARSDVPKVCV